MAEYELYCFAQSGNSYRVALMLNLIGADWKPVFVDFFVKGVQRTLEFRSTLNEMGEAPVLVHGSKTLSQSGVILTYLAEHTGKFLPRGDDARLEALRWIIFDNQKLNGSLAPYRYLYALAKPRGDPVILNFLKTRADGPLSILDKRACRPAVRARRGADHRRPFAGGLPLLSGGGVRLRHRRRTQEHRGVARPHQGVARLGPSL